MKRHDVVVIGGGIIGLTLARELHKRGRNVLLVERGEPGREASHAAAGMLAHCDPHTPELLRPLAEASAELWPEFVRELHDESKLPIDFRSQGTLLFSEIPAACKGVKTLSGEELEGLEPEVVPEGGAYWLPEASVDPRQACAALAASLKHRGVDMATGTSAVEAIVERGAVVGVRTERGKYEAELVVNCAGAWASHIAPVAVPTKPVKGQMLSVVPKHGTSFSLKHVVRSPRAYLVPRSDGRIVIGTTVEDAGFDKRIQADTIQQLHQQAAIVLPEIGEARILEAWAGLRPGSPDGLPMMGETTLKGYFTNTGHYRDGILLAPASAVALAALLLGRKPAMDIDAFSPQRFKA